MLFNGMPVIDTPSNPGTPCKYGGDFMTLHHGKMSEQGMQFVYLAMTLTHAKVVSIADEAERQSNGVGMTRSTCLHTEALWPDIYDLSTTIIYPACQSQ